MNMKKVSWFFIGNKELSVIRADGVCEVRVHIRIHISFSLEHLECDAPIRMLKTRPIQLDLNYTRRIVESNN